MSVVSGLLLLAGLQLIAAQTPALLPLEPSPDENMPLECQNPPPGMHNPLSCCVSPKFISPESFQECGMQDLEKELDKEPPSALSDWNVLQAREYERGVVRRPRNRENMPANPDILNMPGFQGRRQGDDIIPDCSKQHCVLKKNELFKDDKIDYTAVQNMLSVYAQANPETANAILKIREHCFGRKLPGPSFVCEADKLFFCISTNFFYNCPHWHEHPKCQEIRNYLDKCQQYMPNLSK